jgi:cell division protein FtsQ
VTRTFVDDTGAEAGDDTDPLEPAGRPDRRRTVLILVAATVLVAVLVVWLVAFSSVFGVRTVDVRGVRTLTAAQVRTAADIGHGTPLLRLDTAAITSRVERLADVESAQVSTSFPSTVIITVTERAPVGWVRTGGKDLLVDRTGDQYRTVTTVPAGLPKFVVPAGTSARTTGGAVATVAAALPAALRKEVTSIEALDPDAITLVLTHGRVVRWGNARRSADKARLLPALLKHDTTQIDVTDPDQPFTR